MSEEKVNEKEENQTYKEQKIKVFYFHHYDELSRLNPMILVDNGKIWHTAIKKKINGVNMYYIFYSNSSYLKLWQDKKGNLLFDIDNYRGNLFYDIEPIIWYINWVYYDLHWDDNSLSFDDIKLNFSMHIFKIVGQINAGLEIPTAYILYELYHQNS
jgi:hypothetical protein